MSPDIQIAIDADDPHELNRFWAAVMTTRSRIITTR